MQMHPYSSCLVPHPVGELVPWVGAGCFYNDRPSPSPALPAPCAQMVGLWPQAAVKGIDRRAFGQGGIDIGQFKPSRRKIHVSS